MQLAIQPIKLTADRYVFLDRAIDLSLVPVIARWPTPPSDASELSVVAVDDRTMRSTPESGHRAGYGGYKCTKGSQVHIAVDTLGFLLAVRVTPANEQE